MKSKFLLFLLLLIFSSSIFSQGIDGVFKDRWIIRGKPDSPRRVFYIDKDTTSIKLDSGWTISGETEGIPYQHTLNTDSIHQIKIDKPVDITFKLKLSEVKHEDDKSDKLYFNTYHLKNSKESIYEGKGYIKVPENGYTTLVKSYLKISAISVPFTVRPALNDSIGQLVSNDLNLGASLSYNINLEFFKNRRIQAKKSVYGISAGLGFGLSKVTLDSASTSLSSNSYDSSQDGVALSLLPGIGINFKGFQVLAFYGLDFALTKNVKDWNYNKKPYFGFGIGFDISTFSKIL